MKTCCCKSQTVSWFFSLGCPKKCSNDSKEPESISKKAQKAPGLSCNSVSIMIHLLLYVSNRDSISKGPNDPASNIYFPKPRFFKLYSYLYRGQPSLLLRKFKPGHIIRSIHHHVVCWKRLTRWLVGHLRTSAGSGRQRPCPLQRRLYLKTSGPSRCQSMRRFWIPMITIFMRTWWHRRDHLSLFAFAMILTARSSRMCMFQTSASLYLSSDVHVKLCMPVTNWLWWEENTTTNKKFWPNNDSVYYSRRTIIDNVRSLHAHYYCSDFTKHMIGRCTNKNVTETQSIISPWHRRSKIRPCISHSFLPRSYRHWKYRFCRTCLLIHRKQTFNSDFAINIVTTGDSKRQDWNPMNFNRSISYSFAAIACGATTAGLYTFQLTGLSIPYRAYWLPVGWIYENYLIS